MRVDTIQIGIQTVTIKLHLLNKKASVSSYILVGHVTGIWPMDLNFPVFATGVRIFRASNDVGTLFVGSGSTRILEFSSVRVDPGPTIRGPF